DFGIMKTRCQEPQTMIPGRTPPQSSAVRAVSALAGAICAIALLTGAAEESVPAKPVFTADEIKIILSHGPWPAPVPRDPTNRASGKPDAIEFGTRLFFDQRLSGEGKVACGSCHVPERNWTDNLRRGVGMMEVNRNTPPVINLRGGRWFGWDGG